MKKKGRKHKLIFFQPRLSVWAILFLFILMFNVSQTFAQNDTSVYFETLVTATADPGRKLFGGKITNIGSKHQGFFLLRGSASWQAAIIRHILS